MSVAGGKSIPEPGRWGGIRFPQGARCGFYRDEEGGSLVEFGIAASLFLTLFFCVTSLSMLAYSYYFVSDAAREATRYAVVRGNTLVADCTAPGPANCIAQTGDIQTLVRNFAFPGIKSSNLNVSTTWLTSLGGSCGTSDNCKSPGNQVQVQVTYSFPLIAPYLPRDTFLLSSTSQMVISQ